MNMTRKATICQSEGGTRTVYVFHVRMSVGGGGEPRPKIVVVVVGVVSMLSRCLVVVALLRVPCVVRSVVPARVHLEAISLGGVVLQDVQLLEWPN